MNGLEYAEPTIGEVITDKYRLTRMIGRGGMGSVWEGVHVTLGTKVAVKFIDPVYAESTEARQRFENEARAAAKLNSKYAVKVFDHGVMPDGRPFIVMEFLVGEPLDARLDREGSISLVETAQIVAQVCRGLSRAHGAGIVHRDLKPENIFLVWDEEDGAKVAKVVDFGIAKFTENKLGISSSTRTGSVLGTPFYMSPEQARGLRTVDYRTDLWSIGVIVYRCVVGRLPFEGESLGDLLVKICTSPLPIPSEVLPGCSPAFDAWFARALSREPESRFATAQELADQLLSIAGIGTMRAPFASEIQGEAQRNDAFGGMRSLGGAPTGGAVPGVTGRPNGNTDATFAKSHHDGTRKRTVVWGAFGSIAVLGLVAATAVILSRKAPSVDARPAGSDASVSSGVSAAAAPTMQGSDSAVVVRPVSSAAPALAPTVAGGADAAAAIAPASSAGSSGVKASSSKKGGIALGRPAPQIAVPSPVTAPTPAPAPAPPSARRPRPIDVGY